MAPRSLARNRHEEPLGRHHEVDTRPRRAQRSGKASSDLKTRAASKAIAAPTTYRSPFADVIPQEQSLAHFVFADVARYAGRTAIIEGPTGRTLTYGQLWEAIRRTAAGLVARGLRQGDVVAIYSSNVPEYVIAFYGASCAGGVVTTVNPLYSLTEFTHQLRDSSARFLIADPQRMGTARQGAAQLGIDYVFNFAGANDGGIGFDTLATHPDTLAPLEIEPRANIAVLPYSSGTTGLPKGVMLTHSSIVTNMLQIAAVEHITPQDVLAATLPFYHIYGMVVVMMVGLRAGATIVTLPRFEVSTFLNVLQRHQVTRAYVVPPLVRTLAIHPLVDQYDLSSLRDVISGGAPLPESIARLCAERNHCIVRQLYGLTECSPVTHISPRAAPRMNSVGVAVPNTEFRIVDVGLQQEVLAGELGEVWIRGPQVMVGYLNNPDATSRMVDPEGWLHTGDIGYADRDGYLYVVDRAKELVKFRGLQYGENELLLAMVEEISLRRQAADRVNFQALLLDSVRESVVATDLLNRVIFWNKGAEALFGYRSSEAIGKSLDALIVPQDPTVRATHEADLRTLRRTGNWKGQAIRNRKDGTHIWTDLVASTISGADGQVSGLIAIDRDVTEHKAAEQRLRFQAQLLDSVRESVVAIDLDGRFVFWGRGAEALFGYSAAEIIGQPLAWLILPTLEDTAEEVNRIRDLVLEKGMWRAEAVRRTKSGTEFHADIAVAPVKDGRGRPTGLIALHRDITTLRRNEETIRQSRERMRNLAARLIVIREQERTAIARELHDELGQALTGLGIDLRWLLDSLAPRLRNGRAASMPALVDQLLDRVRDMCGQLRPAILDDLGLEAAIEWQAQEFADRTGCRCKLDLRLTPLKAQRDRDTAAFRIVQEALTNVARHARAKHVTLRGRVTDDEVVLQIEDDGVGFDESRLSSAQSLGLLGMRERAEAVGGAVTIEARLRQGAKVKVRMPCRKGRS